MQEIQVLHALTLASTPACWEGPCHNNACLHALRKVKTADTPTTALHNAEGCLEVQRVALVRPSCIEKIRAHCCKATGLWAVLWHEAVAGRAVATSKTSAHESSICRLPHCRLAQTRCTVKHDCQSRSPSKALRFGDSATTLASLDVVTSCARCWHLTGRTQERSNTKETMKPLGRSAADVSASTTCPSCDPNKAIPTLNPKP